MGTKYIKGAKYVVDSRIISEKYKHTPPEYDEFPGRNEPFWPNFLLKEWMIGSVAVVGILSLVVSHPAPLGDIADPNNTNFTPLPDWYFLFLYQLLKYPWAAGEYVIFGTMIIPGFAFISLLLAPFLDRGPERRFYRRPLTSLFMFIGLVSVVYLTYASVVAHAHDVANQQASQEAPAAVSEDASPGEKLYASQQSCISCHAADMSGGFGPALTAVGSKYNADQIKDIIVNGKGQMPAGQFQGTEEELGQLVEHLASLK